MHLNLKAIAVVLATQSWQSVPAAQKVVLVAGGGERPDGSPAVEAKLDSPFGVDFDRAGNLFLVELTGQRLRKIGPDGILSTVAGDGKQGNRGDGGLAKQAQFNGTRNLAIGPTIRYTSPTPATTAGVRLIHTVRKSRVRRKRRPTPEPSSK